MFYFLHSFLPNSKFKNRCVADAKAPLMKENNIIKPATMV